MAEGIRLAHRLQGERGHLRLKSGDTLLEELVLGATAAQLIFELLDVRLLALPTTLGGQAVLEQSFSQLLVHFRQVVGPALR